MNPLEITQNTALVSQAFGEAFPTLSLEEQIIAQSLYGLLAEARPVTIMRLASHANLSQESVNATIIQWPEVEYDADRLIVGFLGLTINTTPYKFVVNNRTVFTWCAWDSLFIPELLNATASVSSHCTISNELIVLKVSPVKLEAADPATTVVSFLVPTLDALKSNVTCNFCHYVNFFDSAESGEKWTQRHPGSFLLTVDDAYHLGKRVNRARYPGLIVDLQR